MKQFLALIINLLLFLVLTGSVAFSQKNSWAIGFDYGAIGTICQKGDVIDSYGNNGILLRSFALTASYNITDHLSITTGMGYVIKELQFKRLNEPYGLTLDKDSRLWGYGNGAYESVEIPIKLNYSIFLGKSRFYFIGSAGFVVDVVVDENTWEDTHVFGGYGWDNDFNFVYTEPTMLLYHKKVNFLINAGIGFGYRFKCGIGLSLTGDYNVGTRMMGEVDIKNQFINMFDQTTVLKEYVDRLYFKGDYWKLALGISYTFKQKNKKSVEEMPIE